MFGRAMCPQRHAQHTHACTANSVPVAAVPAAEVIVFVTAAVPRTVDDMMLVVSRLVVVLGGAVCAEALE